MAVMEKGVAGDSVGSPTKSDRVPGWSVTVKTLKDAGNVDPGVMKVVVASGEDKPVITLLRRFAGGNAQGLVDPRSYIADGVSLQPDSVVAGESRLEGKIAFGKRVKLYNCKMEIRGSAEIRDDTELNEYSILSVAEHMVIPPRG